MDAVKTASLSLVGIMWMILRIALGVFVMAVLLLMFLQEKLIFFPSKLPADYKFDYKTPFEEKWFDVQGAKVHALKFSAVNPKASVLYFHGNGGDMREWGELGAELSVKLQSDVWMVDYPGYGKSEGSVSNEAQLHELATAMWEAAEKESHLPIVVFGRSLGSGIAVQLAAEKKPLALILETPYFSVLSLAKERFPWLPIALLLKYPLRSDEWIKKVECPILMIHGTDDEVIPHPNSPKLLAVAGPRAQLVTIAHGHHNDLDAYQEYWPTLSQWLDKQFNR